MAASRIYNRPKKIDPYWGRSPNLYLMLKEVQVFVGHYNYVHICAIKTYCFQNMFIFLRHSFQDQVRYMCWKGLNSPCFLSSLYLGVVIYFP